MQRFSVASIAIERIIQNSILRKDRRMRPCGAVLLLLAVLLPLKGGTISLDFEGFPDSTALTTQYPGVTFSDATVITAGVTLNEFELPPHSGTNVVFDDGGPMTISFASPVLSFGGYFTYYEPLTLQAFDASDTQIASVTSTFSINVACGDGPPCLGDPGSSPNEFLQVAFPSGISSVTITGDPAGTSFVLDDAMYSASATTVPEPRSTIVLGALIILMLRCSSNPRPKNKPIN
jgi:hypothetical protein